MTQSSLNARRYLLRYSFALAATPWALRATAQASNAPGASNPGAAGAAGTVVQLSGKAKAERNGRNEDLYVNSEVLESDNISTELQSEAVIRLSDGSVMAMRPNTSINVASYRYSANAVGADVVALRLLRGALRVVTGLVGKRNPNQFRLQTPTATIGIRGTDFETVVREDDTDGVDAGTYNQVFSGATVFESNGKTVEVKSGQAAFAPKDLLKIAKDFGLLKKVPPIFGLGKYDNLLEGFQTELTKKIETELMRKLPAELKNSVPNLMDLFKKR